MLVRGGAAYYKTALVALLASLQSEKVGEDRKLERTQTEKPRGHAETIQERQRLLPCGRRKACKTDELEEIQGVEATTRGIAAKNEEQTNCRGKSAQINEQHRDQKFARTSLPVPTLTHTLTRSTALLSSHPHDPSREAQRRTASQ